MTINRHASSLNQAWRSAANAYETSPACGFINCSTRLYTVPPLSQLNILLGKSAFRRTWTSILSRIHAGLRTQHMTRVFGNRRTSPDVIAHQARLVSKTVLAAGVSA